MGAYGGPDIITDGLLFAIDAGSERSYPGSGTTWTDIVGSSDCALVNGPTFNSQNGGSIVLDGSDDYVLRSTTPTELQGDPSFTISMWVKRLANEGTNTGIWGFGGNSTNGGINSWWYNNSNQITIDTWGRATFTSGQTYPLNEWVFVTWQKTAGAMTRANCILWKNTTSYTGTDLTVLRAESTAPNINNAGISLGRIHYSYGSPVNFQYANTLIYNRVLTASEVIQNYNAQKNRFI
jgi:hypothetical protein